MRLIAPPIIPDRNPRKDPIPEDKMQLGRAVLTVLPEVRFTDHVAYRYPQTSPWTTHHMTLREWRRVMANPDVVIVRYGEAQATTQTGRYRATVGESW